MQGKIPFAGGLCTVLGRQLVLLNANATAVERSVALADALARLALAEPTMSNEARRFLDVVLDNPATQAVLTWSLSDRYVDPPEEWKLAGWRYRKTPYDAKMRRKPLWTAMAQAFQERRVSY